MSVFVRAGGYGRKAVYASVGMVSAAALCYPDEVVDMANQGWYYVRDKMQKPGNHNPEYMYQFLIIHAGLETSHPLAFQVWLDECKLN